MGKRPILTLSPRKMIDPPGAVAEATGFFMIWTKTGWPPRKAHDDFASADTEAQRLARMHPGKKFIVLKAVAKYHVTPSLTPPGPPATTPEPKQ